MGKVSKVDGAKVRGKMSKESNEVHRVRNGREFVYTINHPNTAPASQAQKNHRSIFGKTNAIVNAIMSDPTQVAEWTQRMQEFNRQQNPYLDITQKRYLTVRQFAYAVVSAQLKQKPSARRHYAALPFVLPRGVRKQIKPFSDLSAKELYEILKARFNVFVLEQNIRYLDEDNIDYLATHFSLRKNGLVLAYARLFPDAEKGVLRVGRMLTTERNKGFGRYLMTLIIAEAQRQGAHTLRLHAQLTAVAFYEQFGFQPVGDIFSEADIPHLCMELTL